MRRGAIAGPAQAAASQYPPKARVPNGCLPTAGDGITVPVVAVSGICRGTVTSASAAGLSASPVQGVRPGA